MPFFPLLKFSPTSSNQIIQVMQPLRRPSSSRGGDADSSERQRCVDEHLVIYRTLVSVRWNQNINVNCHRSSLRCSLRHSAEDQPRQRLKFVSVLHDAEQRRGQERRGRFWIVSLKLPSNVLLCLFLFFKSVPAFFLIHGWM